MAGQHTHVLDRCNLYDAEAVVIHPSWLPNPTKVIFITKAQLCWVGHLVRMSYDRIPKVTFYSELQIASRPRRQSKSYKDCLKFNLSNGDIDPRSWEAVATDRTTWRHYVFQRCSSFWETWCKVTETRTSPVTITLITISVVSTTIRLQRF